MIANIVANLFGADYNWPLGAAVALVILVMVLVILTITQKLERRWRVA
jgi:spermidine/putrescine transport system permease protein